jgi:hypothetical protein
MGNCTPCVDRSGSNKYLKLEKDDGLSNFNMSGPDRDPLTDFEIKSFNSTQLFEHKWPFYRMDVNGFTYLTKKAALL